MFRFRITFGLLPRSLLLLHYFTPHMQVQTILRYSNVSSTLATTCLRHGHRGNLCHTLPCAREWGDDTGRVPGYPDTHAGMSQVILYTQLMAGGHLTIHLFLKMAFKLTSDSSSFIAHIKVRGRSKYLKAVFRSLGPMKVNLVVQLVDISDLFLAILDKLIINYIITLLVSL